jgi:hypothetical protein
LDESRGDIPGSLARGRDCLDAWGQDRKVGTRNPDQLWSLAVRSRRIAPVSLSHPKEPFYMLFRMYLPDIEVLNGQYVLAGVVKAK